ncbi:MAG: hypothetical protein H6713_14830 [Myxococcales bacterium]|nr:hypothetical protein [Myxococcales bacterium]
MRACWRRGGRRGARLRQHWVQLTPADEPLRCVRRAVIALARQRPNLWGDLEHEAWSPAPAPARPRLPARWFWPRGAEPVAYTCARLGPARSVWLFPGTGRNGRACVVATRDHGDELDALELRARGPERVGAGHELTWWAGETSARDPERAMFLLLDRLGADDEGWAARARESFSLAPGRLEVGLAAAGLRGDGLAEALAAAEIDLRAWPIPASHEWSIEPRARWPSRTLRYAWVTPASRGCRLLAVRTRVCDAEPTRSPLVYVPSSRRVGLREWGEPLLLAEGRWSTFEPGALGLGGREFLWLWPEPRACAPPVTVDGRAIVSMRPGAPPSIVSVPLLDDDGYYVDDYQAHRAAVLAVARAAWRARELGALQPGRLEGVLVSYDVFREAYDAAAASPVMGRSSSPPSRPWTAVHYGDVTPARVYRWSGAWNPEWRHGYEFWGCHVWTLERPARRAAAPRQIDVVVDVQTD